MEENKRLTRRGVLGLFLIASIAGLLVVTYGVLLTIFKGNASRWGLVFLDFEDFIKWVSWTIGIASIFYIFLSTNKKIIKWLSGIAGALAIINIVFRFFIPDTHYSEHVLNGLGILGLTLSLYKDVHDNL